MKKLNQAGFIHWLLWLIILLLLLLLAGWKVYQSQNSSSQPASSSEKQSDSKSEAASKDDKPAAQKYMEVKEFAVKLPLSDGITGLYYVIRDKTAGDPAEYADVFDSGFDNTANSKGVKCKDSKFPLFVISRVKPADLAEVSEQDKDSYKLLAISASHQFSGVQANQAYPQCANLTPDAATTTNDKTVLDLFEAKKKDITSAYSKIEKL